MRPSPHTRLPGARTSCLVAVALAVAIAACAAAPARAMTTQQERAWGTQVARSVVDEQGTLDDRLLQQWVNRVGATLASHAVRNELPYTFTIVDSEEVNAFSLPGGFIFVDAGLLNFVRSDDELAAVLGHEIGHVERRHVVTLSQKAKALQIVLDLAGIFAPGISRFGNLAGNLALYKLARVDELQADQYGLMLMSQAGYDPQAMVTFLTRLGEDSPHANRLLQRYFETHPALPDRVRHVQGYAQLDNPSPDALLTQAIHDAETGEYLAAREKLQGLPVGSPLAQAYRGKIAAIFDGMQAAAQPDRAAETTAPAKLAASGPLAALLPLAERDRDNYEKLLDGLDYSVDPQSLQSVGENSRLRRVLEGQVRAGRYFDHSFDQIAQTIVEAQDASDAATRLLAQAGSTASAAYQSDEVRRLASAAGHASVQALQAARGAIAVGFHSAKTLRAFLDDFDAVSNYKGGDMQAADYRGLHEPLHAALLAARTAASSADTAAGLLNTAKAELILAHLDALDLLATPARRASFAALLHHRLGVDQSEVDHAAGMGFNAGEICVAAIGAAASGQPLSAMVTRRLTAGAGTTALIANSGVRPETLELELGLVWSSYSDADL